MSIRLNPNRRLGQALCAIAEAYCNAAYAAVDPRSLIERRLVLEGAPPLKERIRLANRRIRLRNMLSRTPWWVRGHIDLGFTELSLQQFVEGKKDLRALQAIRISARAALELAGKREGRHPLKKELEALFLLALCDFYVKRFAEALELFREIVKFPDRQAVLSEEIDCLASEYAGYAAMTLQLSDEALKYLNQIPHGKRSAAVNEALTLLETAAEAKTN